jgi:hypothetical protein
MGICMWPHWDAICLQQARSDCVICVPGRTQAIAGVTSGRRTARINANWRIAFMRRISNRRPHQFTLIGQQGGFKPTRTSNTSFNAEPVACSTYYARAWKIAALAAGTVVVCRFAGDASFALLEVTLGAVSVSIRCHFE